MNNIGKFCSGCNQKDLCLCLTFANKKLNDDSIKTNKMNNICELGNTKSHNTQIKNSKTTSNNKHKSSSKYSKSSITYSPLVYNLITRLLDPNPETRITAEEALNHPLFQTSDS